MQSENRSGLKICHLENKNILREKRVILGLTQQQVADKARITLQQYQKFESGARDIMTSSFQIACRVIEALGMDISEFYHGEYAFGEDVYLESGAIKYRKTGRDINEEPASAVPIRNQI